MKNLCFKIENKNLYLDKVFSEFERIPVLFTCKSEDEIFLVQMADMPKEGFIYYIFPVKQEEWSLLINKGISIRDFMLGCKYFYLVEDLGDQPEKVFKLGINKISKGMLIKPDIFL